MEQQAQSPPYRILPIVYRRVMLVPLEHSEGFKDPQLPNSSAFMNQPHPLRALRTRNCGTAPTVGVGGLRALRQPVEQPPPGTEVRLNRLGAFGGAASRTLCCFIFVLCQCATVLSGMRGCCRRGTAATPDNTACSVFRGAQATTRRTGGPPLVLNSEMGVLWAGLCMCYLDHLQATAVRSSHPHCASATAR
jgi:hypothetical protein